MRHPRRLAPGTWWFVTLRCARSEFRLRPDAKRRQIVGFSVAKALGGCPGIRVLALVQMSNHLHLVLQDRSAELSNFMCRLAGPLAKRINRLDNFKGQLFERRYSAIPILDELALGERIVYTVTNPVSADLVTEPSRWPGLLMWIGGSTREEFSHDLKPASLGGRSTCCLQLPGETPEDLSLSHLQRAVKDKVAEIRRKRRRVLGVARVKNMKVFSSPKRPKKSKAPICHSSSKKARADYLCFWRSFVQSYRSASEAFRKGEWGVPFPDYCFRPWVPLKS